MTIHVRALFVSDVHLGTRCCQAEYLLKLLYRVRPRKLFLVGDIIDVEEMGKSPYWHPQHTAVVRRLIEMARNGTEVTYIPGNHDAAFRRLDGRNLMGIQIRRESDYVCANGARLRVRHGDELDPEVTARRGSLREGAYLILRLLNRWVNMGRRQFMLDYFPLLVSLKKSVPQAFAVVERFSRRALAEAARLDVDGYVCGHIHFGEIQQTDGLVYANDGDFVEHCTALWETRDGALELWQCTNKLERLQRLEADAFAPHSVAAPMAA